MTKETASLPRPPEPMLLATQEIMFDTFMEKDVADILIQHGQPGRGMSYLASCLLRGRDLYIVNYDPIAEKHKDFKRHLEDAYMFSKVPVLVLVEGGERIREADCNLILKTLETKELKVIINCNDLDAVPWKVRGPAIASYFPPLTPEELEPLYGDHPLWPDIQHARDFRTINNIIAAGGADTPDPTKAFKNPEQEYWAKYRYVEARENLAQVDIMLSRVQDVGYRQWKYAAGLLELTHVATRRKYHKKVDVEKSIAKKLGPIIKDSQRERLRYHIPAIKGMTAPSLTHVLQGLDFTDTELKRCGFKRIKADKRQFKVPPPPPPKGENIDKYF